MPVYLRPETAQGMFVNFKNTIDSYHPKLPFGIAQVGKSFRNEIAPRDFIFRVRELEIMEFEYFLAGKTGRSFLNIGARRCANGLHHLVSRRRISKRWR